jgi:cytoskeletal protein CcmA (bactofilin family)
MFNKNSKLEAEEITTSNNIIGKGTLIEGKLEAGANIRIEGKLVGEIKTKAKIALGEGAIIEGNILAQNAEIAGTVKGNIEVTGLLVLKSTCNVTGDIHTNKLIVETGASFNGNCKMGAIVKEINLRENAGGNQREKSA